MWEPYLSFDLTALWLPSLAQLRQHAHVDARTRRERVGRCECELQERGRLLKQRPRSRQRRRRKDSLLDSNVVRDETRDDPSDNGG